jgi:hypothetical protein
MILVALGHEFGCVWHANSLLVGWFLQYLKANGNEKFNFVVFHGIQN